MLTFEVLFGFIYMALWKTDGWKEGSENALNLPPISHFLRSATNHVIRNLKGYEAKDWMKICGEMKELFQVHNRPLYTKEYLNELVGKGQGTDLKLFIATVQAVSDDLVKREVISKRQQVLEFIVGLGSHLCQKAFDFAA